MTLSAADPVEIELGDVGVVAIGRNEGARLLGCLKSTLGRAAVVVYVDSGSSDGSVPAARALGVKTVELNMTLPFTAARARNAGFALIAKEAPHVQFVQFVDGDCEVVSGWLKTARDCLAAQPDVAAVFGRRRERHPEVSIYNRLCDEEWAVDPGEVKYCGGDVMIRADAFRAVGGYRDSLIAGEEPELCVRLRQRGYRIVCLPAEMTLHDAAIERFRQWWRRSTRSGHSFAEGAYIHGAPPERHRVRESRRIWLWGAAVPAGILTSIFVLGLPGAASALIYPAQMTRLYLRRRYKSNVPLRASLFQVLGNIPEALGQLRFHSNRLRNREIQIIEYK